MATFTPTRWCRMCTVAGAAVLAACGTVQRPAPAPAPTTQPGLPAPTVPPAVPPVTVYPATPAPAIPPQASPRVSGAATALAYRRDAATHLYASNSDRIYKGVMQPQLYAIGVLDVDIDGRGQVTNISWRRAPTHAPEVMAEIIRTVRAAAPYPAPARMGRVTYTDIWLWDKSGKFQLDTLTEGQL
jgi:protein TonB